MIQRSLMSVVLMGCTIPHVFTSAQSSNKGDLLQGNFKVVFINGTATLVRTLEPEKVLEKVPKMDAKSVQTGVQTVFLCSTVVTFMFHE